VAEKNLLLAAHEATSEKPALPDGRQQGRHTAPMTDETERRLRDLLPEA